MTNQYRATTGGGAGQGVFASFPTFEGPHFFGAIREIGGFALHERPAQTDIGGGSEDLLLGDYDRGNSKGGKGFKGKNTDPVAVDDSGAGFQGDADTPFQTTSVLANDTDRNGDLLTITSVDVTATAGLITQRADGSFGYDPNGRFDALADGEIGYDYFSYTIDDGRGGRSTATVTISVVGTADPDEAIVPDDPAPEETPLEPVPNYITALMRGEEFRHNASEPLGTPATVTFAFAPETPHYYASSSFAWDSFSSFSDAQQIAARSALADISSYSGLDFVETSADEAAIIFGTAATGSRGFAYYPTAESIGSIAGDIWLDKNLASMSIDPGSEAYKTLIHEIGHALGLTHPALPSEVETRQYTVMAAYPHPSMDGDPATHMIFDMATVQYLYGANMYHAVGDDIYETARFEGRTSTLWDAGGHDLLDMSNAAFGVVLDLREGRHSTVDASGTNNLAIAYGTTIEDASGGDSDDRLVGNETANLLTGGGGNDTFVFAPNWGTDTIADFEDGTDTIDLTATGCAFADLVFEEVGAGARIGLAESTILLEGVALTVIDAEDFLFA